MKSDESIQVKDSAAWTVGRICEQVPTAVLRTDVLTHLLQALASGLDREPRVATNVCWVSITLSDNCSTLYLYRPFLL